MAVATETLGRLLDTFTEHLDIPKSLYEKAAKRHVDLGEWLLAQGVCCSHVFDPDVRPQGSFRFGTVIYPLKT